MEEATGAANEFVSPFSEFCFSFIQFIYSSLSIVVWGNPSRFIKTGCLNCPEIKTKPPDGMVPRFRRWFLVSLSLSGFNKYHYRLRKVKKAEDKDNGDRMYSKADGTL